MADQDQKLSVRETADSLGRSVKAVQQMIARDAFPGIEREVNKDTGKVLRVWIPYQDVEAYAKKRGIRLREAPSKRLAVVADPLFSARRQTGGDDTDGGSRPPPWRSVLDELQRENLDLRLRLAELEAALAERPSK